MKPGDRIEFFDFGMLEDGTFGHGWRPGTLLEIRQPKGGIHSSKSATADIRDDEGNEFAMSASEVRPMPAVDQLGELVEEDQ
jgi:hypothetical protein